MVTGADRDTYEAQDVRMLFGPGIMLPTDRMSFTVSYKVSLDTERNRHERRRGDALRRRSGEPPVMRVKLTK